MASGGGKRKIGNKKKQPAMKRYTSVKRWLINKERKVQRHNKRMQKQQTKKVKVPRGTTRKLRRSKAK